MMYIRAWMSSKFGQILSGTTELAALEQLKSMLALLIVSQLWFYLGNSQVSVYRTIGPLVFCSNDNPVLILTYFTASSILQLRRLYGKM